MRLPDAVRAELFAEASRCWPREACGVVVGPADEPGAWRFIAFENLQDKLHAQDPQTHPRDATTAYAMHPLKLQRLVDAEEAAGNVLVAIAHSHPSHPAYFSKTDARSAAPWGTPTFPGAVQLVVSVYEHTVRDVKGFVWKDADWTEVALCGVEDLPGPPPGAVPYGDV